MQLNTLYLRNLPRRPRSNTNFIRLLLKHIDNDNKYVNSSIPLPRNETIGNANLQLLDTHLGIVEVSRSVKLENQCFITFIDDQHAAQFKEKFQQLKVGGRDVDIQFAEKNSLLGLALINQDLLQSVLKRRKKSDLSVARQRRKLRRLRSKLRGKGLDEGEIRKAIEKFKDTTVEVKPRKIKDVVISGNPVNKVLLVQNLPHATTQETITELFHSSSLVEIRLVDVRHLAFVEYSSIEDATAMRNKLGPTYSWNGHLINIEFAK